MMTKIKYIITTAAFLLAAVVVSAQNKSAGINLSLWNGVATQPYNPQQKTYLNLGIATKQYNLYGVGINLLGTLVKQDSYGLQLSGLYHIAGEQRGVSFAGLAQMVASDAKGINASGLFNIIAESHSGVLAAGLFNIVGNDMSGVNLSGLLNINGDDVKGVSIAGLSTIAGEDNNGVTISGLFNITGNKQRGIALSGLFNLSDEMVGLSATSLFNITNQASGLQLSLFNIASRIKGAQIGLININGDEKYGYQLGLINLSPSTKIQAMAYGGNLSKMSLAVRFKNKNYYNIVGISSPSYLSFSDKFSGAILYRTGGYLNLSKHFDISADLGYQHINSFKNRLDETTPHRMYALEGRVNLEYNISNKLGMLATAGYGTSKKYGESHSFRKGWLVEGGLFYTLNRVK